LGIKMTKTKKQLSLETAEIKDFWGPKKQKLFVERLGRENE